MKNTIVALILLVVGIAVGYAYGQNSSPTINDTANTNQNQDMGHTMHMMVDGLAGKTGEEFDREFLKEMIVHHQGAIEMSKLVLEKSQNQDIRLLATNIIELQLDEIILMNNLLLDESAPNNITLPPGDDSSDSDTQLPSDPVACTMDAKICPDGSAVGRIAPNCDFARCPNE